MSLKTQQVTKEATAKRAQAAPAVIDRVRGFSGNHTLMRKQSTTEEFQRKPPETQHLVRGKHKEQFLQRKASNEAEPSRVPPIVDEALRSPGQPLDATTRAFMEPRFGHEFSRVRVHADEKAGESAQAVNALAYTVGQNIAFAFGQFEPKTAEGRRLLAHELAHTIQQPTASLPVPATVDMTLRTHLTEMEAANAADAVMRGEAPALSPNSRSPFGPQRLSRQTSRKEGEQSEPSEERVQEPDTGPAVTKARDKDNVVVLIDDVRILTIRLPGGEGEVNVVPTWDGSTKTLKLQVTIPHGSETETPPDAANRLKTLPNVLVLLLKVTDSAFGEGAPSSEQNRPELVLSVPTASETEFKKKFKADKPTATSGPIKSEKTAETKTAGSADPGQSRSEKVDGVVGQSAIAALDAHFAPSVGFSALSMPILPAAADATFVAGNSGKEAQGGKSVENRSEGESSALETGVDIATDFIPFVGSGKDIYKGIRDGNGWMIALGVGGLVLDVFTFGSASIVKGGVKTLVKQGAKELVEQGAKQVIEQGGKEVIKQGGKEIIEQGGKEVLDRGITVLGNHPHYEELAHELDAAYFQVLPAKWEAMTKAEQKAANLEFLEIQVNWGSEFRLSNSGIKPKGSSFPMEIKYMTSKKVGYKLAPDGMSLIKK